MIQDTTVAAFIGYICSLQRL